MIYNFSKVNTYSKKVGQPRLRTIVQSLYLSHSLKTAYFIQRLTDFWCSLKDHKVISGFFNFSIISYSFLLHFFAIFCQMFSNMFASTTVGMLYSPGNHTPHMGWHLFITTIWVFQRLHINQHIHLILISGKIQDFLSIQDSYYPIGKK